MDDITNLNVDELRAQMLGLNVESAAKRTILKEKRDALCKHITHVLEKNIGISSVKIDCSELGAEIFVANEHKISLYFDKQYLDFDKQYLNNERKRCRILRLNFGCFGSFVKSDESAVKYCKMLGHIAGIMGILEEQLLASDAAKKIWDEFDNAWHDSYRAYDKVRIVSNEIGCREHAAKTSSVMSMLAVGRKVMVSKPSAYCCAQVKTIKSITEKNIIFEEDGGKRTKKDHVVENIISGKWII